MRFVQNFAPPKYQSETFTPSISPNFNSFSDKNIKKMNENGEIYTAGKNFTLPPAVMTLTNSTSTRNLTPNISLLGMDRGKEGHFSVGTVGTLEGRGYRGG